MNAILRALALLMTTSVVTILAGILRQKMLALELGPAGVGQLGLLMALTGAAATIGGLGLSTSGVQRVSTTKEGEQAGAAQKGLLLGSAALALVAGVLVALLAPSLGLPAGGPDRYATAFAVALTIASAGQIALLNGLGRIRDIAWINGLSAVLATLVTVVLLLTTPQWGFYGALLLPPAFMYVLGHHFRLRQRLSLAGVPWQAGVSQLRAMLGLGVVFAAGLGVGNLGLYAARWYIGQRFGEESLGQYQAAWSITMVYLGVLLSSMSVEFFPRVSRVVAGNDLGQLRRVIGNQITLTLALALPVICLFILFSDFVMTLLYTPDFAPAAELARTQFIGDIFKLAAWSFSYTLLARDARLHIFLVEVAWVIVYLLLLVLLADRLGFAGVGWAYVGAYAVYLPAAAVAYRHHTGQGIAGNSWLLILAAVAWAGLHLAAEASVYRWGMAGLDLLALAGAAAWWLKRRKANATGKHPEPANVPQEVI